jgi:hypothetical protein
LVAALANVAGSATVPLVSQPVRIHGSESLGTLSTDGHEHLARRFGVYGQLRDLAAGGAITVPDQRILDDYTLAHYSLLEVAVEDYPVELTDGQAQILLENTRFSGETEVVGRKMRPYVVVSASDEVTALRLVLFGDALFIVEESLYAAVEGMDS